MRPGGARCVGCTSGEEMLSMLEVISSTRLFTNFGATAGAPPGLIEGVQTPEMITRHFRNTLYYIQTKKIAASNGDAGSNSRYDEVDVVGALLKMGIGR